MLKDSKVTWIGDGNAKVSWTRRSDIGYVLAKALEDPNIGRSGGTISMQGDYASFNAATKLLEETLGKTFSVEYLDPEEAKKQEEELLAKGMKGDTGAFFQSFKLHLIGEPARGNSGCDVSAEAKTFGHKLETLKDVFQSGVYGP